MAESKRSWGSEIKVSATSPFTRHFHFRQLSGGRAINLHGERSFAGPMVIRPYRNVPTAGVLDDSLAVNWSGTIVIRHRAFNVIKSPNSYAIACRAALPIRNETVTDQKLRITYGWLIDRTLSLLSVSPRRSLPLLSLSLSLSLSHIYVVCSLLFPVSRAPCKPRESFNSTTTTLSIPSHYDLGLDRKFNSTCISQFLFVDRLRRFAVLRPPAAEC